MGGAKNKYTSLLWKKGTSSNSRMTCNTTSSCTEDSKTSSPTSNPSRDGIPGTLCYSIESKDEQHSCMAGKRRMSRDTTSSCSEDSKSGLISDSDASTAASTSHTAATSDDESTTAATNNPSGDSIAGTLCYSFESEDEQQSFVTDNSRMSRDTTLSCSEDSQQGLSSDIFGLMTYFVFLIKDGKCDDTVQSTENTSIRSTTLLKSTSSIESINIINQDPNQQYFEI